MEQVRLGNTDLHVSRVCFGGWQASPRFWGEVPEADIQAAMHRALECGVNFFDTADAYGEGRGEEIFGRAFAGVRRDAYVMATKVYWHWDETDPERPRYPDLSHDYILRACENSLRRLKTDHIDLYQIHAYDPLTPPEEYFSALEKLKKAGKVRYLGCSNYTSVQLHAAMRVARFDAVQPRYNMMDRESEDDLLPLCQAEKLGVLVYSTLNLGLLTGKFTGREKFDDLRSKRPRFRGEEFQKAVAKVNRLKPIAERLGVSVTRLVIRATLAHPAVHCAIVGVKNAAQIEESAQAMDFSINRETYHEIRTALA
jgi:aryl-alcohol dehydrogenase-like predicted oxidoreductase